MNGKFLILCFCLAFLFWGAPVEAVDPPECTAPPPVNFTPIPFSCGYDGTLTYDLFITEWDVTTPISSDIRVGYSWSDTPPDDQPRFFVYQDGANYRFYTWLYAQFRNDGATACPEEPETGTVRVEYSYCEIPLGDPMPTDPPSSGWTPIGEYTMVIPLSPGALLSTETHQQVYPVCWILPVGQRFPAQFFVKAEVIWDGGTHPDLSGGSTDSIITNNVAYSYFDLSAEKGTAYIGLAMDLSGSMGGSLGLITKLQAAKDTAQLFTHLVENTNYLGVYGFATGNAGKPDDDPPVPGNTTFSASYTLTDSSSSGLLSFNDTSEIASMRIINGLADKIEICNWIDRQDDWGCTPIGQGLLRAKEAIDDATSMVIDPVNKGIVLLSDGLQNIPPLLAGAASGGCSSPLTHPDIDVAKTFGDNDIPIYSIYFGNTAYWGYNVMADIQDESADIWVYGASTELELAEVYYAIRGMVDEFFEVYSHYIRF